MLISHIATLIFYLHIKYLKIAPCTHYLPIVISYASDVINNQRITIDTQWLGNKLLKISLT